MSTTAGFPPLLGTEARVLILGTLPSRKSLEKSQYYGHPRNAFWPIMGALFGAGPDVPYASRVRILTDAGIAVWDVLAASIRPGSMDSAIDPRAAAANDFTALFREQPGIELVCFNGRTAGQLFRKLVAPQLESGSNTPGYRALPSTSPAYAAMSFAEKLERWRVVVMQALHTKGITK